MTRLTDSIKRRLRAVQRRSLDPVVRRQAAPNSYGFNAFFVRNDLGGDLLPEIPVEAGFPHPWNPYGMRERWPLVADLPREQV